MPLTQAQVEIAAQAGFLNEHDGVAISFWIISIAMVASTVFFLMEALTVKDHWKTSLHTGALVTLVAAVHYFYMREFWVKVHATPIVYRYIDWAITVPLQMIEFNLILRAAGRPVGAGMFWRLLLGTVMMLLFGFCGETYVINAWPAFILGMCGWFFILFEVFSQGSTAGDCSPAVQKSYATMRLIVSAGWSIYPAGYFVGYLLARHMPSADAGLNLVYNLADFVNKIGFCLAVWSAAKEDSEK
jgi:bacteriorhodopsin